jgi:hypothetical protein
MYIWLRTTRQLLFRFSLGARNITKKVNFEKILGKSDRRFASHLSPLHLLTLLRSMQKAQTTFAINCF